jgi:hypothetical protein
MMHDFINYNTLYWNIKRDIQSFCIKYDIEYEELKIKTKREILINFSLENILNHIEKLEYHNPVFYFQKEYNNNLFVFCFKKIEKILAFPFFYCECFDCSKGIKKELSKKAESFHEKNIFTLKNVKKELNPDKQSNLIEKIVNFKSLRLVKNKSFEL